MHKHSLQPLDHRALEAAIAREVVSRLAFLRRAILYTAITIVFFVVLNPLINGTPREVFDVSSKSFWIRFSFAIATAALLLVNAYRNEARRRIDPGAVASKTVAEFETLTGPTWFWVTLRMGVLLGLGIAIPVSLLIVLLPGAELETTSSELISALSFTGATLLWTIPAAFIIRVISVRSIRRLAERGETGGRTPP